MELTPMMQQYLAIKEQHPDEILFFRMGDFYEMFLDDAVTASRELGLTLTSRSGDVQKNPMCGIPYHAAESYITKIVNKGYKVAIAEQIGDPKAKGLTKREVIKVITPGTILEESALQSANNNYIALVYETEAEVVLAGADISTGECFYGVYTGDDRLQALYDELYRIMMPELIILGEPSFLGDLKGFIDMRMAACAFTSIEEPVKNVDDLIIQHFDVNNRPAGQAASEAVATMLGYLHETVRTDLSHLSQLTKLDFANNLVIDTYTLRNLEITRNLRDGGKKDTLLDVLDFTDTAMGTRLLKKWLEYPLINIGQINQRLDAVEELTQDFMLRGEVKSSTKSIYDFERLLTRIEVGSVNARDMVALRTSFMALPAIKKLLSDCKSPLLKKCHEGIHLYEDFVDLLNRAIVDSPGLTIRDGGIIKEGYNEELDEYRKISRDSKQLLQEMEEKEKEATGIRTLKIGYNKVFGYYIEVRHSGAELVPDHYVRKQTLANAERYITQELKDFETKILGAEEKIVNIEYNLFMEIRETIKAKLGDIQETARHIAVLDVLAGLAEAASNYNYVRPQLVNNGKIDIKDGRHPLVERILTRDLFVPNDARLNHTDCEIMLITGPNMAGKSTYMRQTALLTLMAQVGSFIPAREASISPVDRIFTRIGASDDLVSGQSTFMVEMNEVAQILKYATRDSLVILDEIGRGTSTFDGMSIARAVIEHIREQVHAKTLFATHYHEVTDLEDDLIKNYCIAVKEKGKDISFLRRIIPGSADKSYGIHVARLAGLPKVVTQRAEKILAALEAEGSKVESIPLTKKQEKAREVAEPDDMMASLFGNSISDELLAMDVMTMTPIEAMNTLYRLQQQAKEEAGKG
ncbi:DNA mismatch repair protein MutS [Anaerovibrio sp. JC8]|uniref:DNA mismatch repair protein MutS n=1 Tax=Anaerovibrio sp. JC8 TaxID=1240085 RepID=UPI000A0C4EC6|nr:DNA mismatch repair protein MutS [Anaerovibrio sp. JC8]ORU00720.1 DNA mismatch repair protein MutS [Anaerovibrio sp. JC8]